MKRRLGRKAFSVGGSAVLLFLAASTAQAGWLFVLAAGVLGLVAGSLGVRHNLNGLEVERSVARRARVGDELRVGITIRNPRGRPSPPLRLEDRHEAFVPVSVLVERIPAGTSAISELVRTAHRRGAFTGGDLVLRTGAPFGFLKSERRVEAESTLTVVPRWVQLRSFPILEPSSFPSDVLHERARTGAGEEYIGVREYRPGDPPRAVHWRSTARVGRLVVREYEEEVASRVTLVLAGADHGTPPESAFESLVSAAASIGIYALSTGHPVEFVGLTDEGQERLVEPDRFAALDWLARVRAGTADVEELVRLGLGAAGRRGTVVLLTTTSDTVEAVERAVRTVQMAGARAIVVAARSRSWDPEAVESDEADLRRAVGGRTALKVLHREGDLTRCLEA